MRHIGSLIGGLIAAPVIWVLLALSQNKSGETVGEWVESGLYDTADLVEPAIYLVLAGIIVGLLATLRVSPLGPFVVAVLYLALYVLLFLNPVRLVDWLPADRAIAGRDLELAVPLANGTLLVLGVALLLSVFSISRWRSRAAVAPVGGGVEVTGDDAFAVAERDAHEARLAAARDRADFEGRTDTDTPTDTPTDADLDERVVRPDDDVVVPSARTGDEDDTELDADGRPVRRTIDTD